MKLKIKQKGLFSNIYTFLLAAIFCLEQIAPKLSTLTIILFCLTVLFQFWLQNIKLNYPKDVLIFQSIYLFGIIGLLYTTDLKTGLHYLETTASLLIAPFFLFNIALSRKQAGLIILAATTFYCIVHFNLVPQYYRSKGIILANLFQAENLTLVLHSRFTEFYAKYAGHHTFLMQYFCIGIFLSTYYLFSSKGYVKIILIVISIVSLASIVLSESRIALVVPIMLFFFYLSLYLKRYLVLNKTYLVAALGLIFLAGGILIIQISDKLVYLYEEQIEYYKAFTEEEAEAYSLSRVVIWGNSIETILNQGIFVGAGTGDSEHHQIEQYKKNGIPEHYHHFNTHNQYLDYQIRYGILGLLCFLGTLLYAFRKAWKSENYLYCGFVLIFMTFCLTENMLQRQAGVVFFAFFNGLLYFSSKPSASSAQAKN